jgi:hypothetical protein
VSDERDHTPIDLSAIDRFPDPTRRHLLGDVAAFWRPTLAAASVIATLAGIAISTTRRRQGDAPEQLQSRLLEWAQSGHVPTNGELIATFAGRER